MNEYSLRCRKEEVSIAGSDHSLIETTIWRIILESNERLRSYIHRNDRGRLGQLLDQYIFTVNPQWLTPLIEKWLSACTEYLVSASQTVIRRSIPLWHCSLDAATVCNSDWRNQVMEVQVLGFKLVQTLGSSPYHGLTRNQYYKLMIKDI